MLLTIRHVMMPVFFWDSNLRALLPLKRQDKIQAISLTSTASPATLLFWAPALLKCLKSLGDRPKNGPQRASATPNCYGKMAHHQAENPAKACLLRDVFAIWRSRQMSDIHLLERQLAHGLIERIDAVATAIVLMDGGSR